LRFVELEAVILAAGKGERMGVISKFTPKPLIPIANCPIIEHLILAYKKAGISDFIIVTGHLGNQIRNQLGDGSRLGVSVRYKRSQNYELGPIHSLLAAENEISTNDFFVSPADFIIDPRAIQTIKKRHTRMGVTVAADIGSRSKSGTTIYTCPTDQKYGRVSGFCEPVLKGGAPHLCVSLLICNTSIFQYIYKALENGSNILPDALNLLIRQGQLVCFIDVSKNFWFDLDTISDILRANEFALKKGFIPQKNFYVKNLKQVRGPLKKKLKIDLDKTSTISGPAILEPNCRIGPRSRVGPFVSLTSECEINSGASVQNSLLFGNAVVEENNHLSNAVLYKNLLLQPV
jgi:bifunctional UDP-N-acetylglucosamine pyrophosphorylase/glucosamine-1-phosphate N-acetyltransferase